jgi:hypothetical protein
LIADFRSGKPFSQACGVGEGGKAAPAHFSKSAMSDNRNTHGRYFWRFAVDGKQI